MRGMRWIGLGWCVGVVACEVSSADPQGACVDYVAEARDCGRQALDDVSAYDPYAIPEFEAQFDGYCAQFQGLEGDDAEFFDQQLTCWTEQYRTGSCRNAKGLSDISTAILDNCAGEPPG